MKPKKYKKYGVSPNAHTYEDMKTALRERIDKIEAGDATFYSNEEVLSNIRDRYGIYDSAVSPSLPTIVVADFH